MSTEYRKKGFWNRVKDAIVLFDDTCVKRVLLLEDERTSDSQVIGTVSRKELELGRQENNKNAENEAHNELLEKMSP